MGFAGGAPPVAIQELLADKFQLKFHREVRTLPSYNLVVAGKVRLAEPRARNCIPDDGLPSTGPGSSLPPCDRVFFSSGPKYSLPVPDEFSTARTLIAHFWAKLDGERATIRSFTVTLSDILGRSISDKTGLAGAFDIHLKFYLGDELAGLEGPEARLGGAYREFDQGAHQPRIGEVLKQLGLALQPDRASVEVLVIDQVEKLPRK